MVVALWVLLPDWRRTVNWSAATARPAMFFTTVSVRGLTQLPRSPTLAGIAPPGLLRVSVAPIWAPEEGSIFSNCASPEVLTDTYR